jgi:hypothetical protein
MFVASLPVTTAIRFYGDGGARLMLDVPATEHDAITELTRYGGKVLSVAIVATEPGDEQAILRDPRARQLKN